VIDQRLGVGDRVLGPGGQAGPGDRRPHLVSGGRGQDGLADRGAVQRDGQPHPGAQLVRLAAVQLRHVHHLVGAAHRQVHRVAGRLAQLPQVRARDLSQEGGVVGAGGDRQQPGAEQVAVLLVIVRPAGLDQALQDPVHGRGGQPGRPGDPGHLALGGERFHHRDDLPDGIRGITHLAIRPPSAPSIS
jgi:hypothetical protein